MMARRELIRLANAADVAGGNNVDKTKNRILCAACHKDVEILDERNGYTSDIAEVTVRCHDRTEIIELSGWRRRSDEMPLLLVLENLKRKSEEAITHERDRALKAVCDHARNAQRLRNVCEGQGNKRIDAMELGTEDFAGLTAVVECVTETVAATRRVDVRSASNQHVLYELFERASTVFAEAAWRMK